MSTFYLKLLGIPGNYKAEKALPDTARAYIAIIQSSTIKVNGKEFSTISAECRTLQEVEGAADCLIEELRSIKKHAAKFFKKEQENRLKIGGKS